MAVLVLLGVMAHEASWEPSAEVFPVVDASLPGNIEAPDAILTTMRRMWMASPSFRRQCARIGRARDGRIVVEIRTKMSHEFQAVSQIERKGVAWRARVEVYIDSKLVEMIAHEFEHIIEQMDSVDLVRLSKQGLQGVMPGSTHFETARAIAAGKRIARECLESGKQAS